MKTFFLKAFNAKPEEFTEVLLLLLLGFLLGIFIATYEVASSTLFLNYFNETTELPFAIILTGIVGILVTSLFSFFQNLITFSRLSLIVVILMLLFTGTVGITLESVSVVWLKQNRWLVFVAFIFSVPMETLILLIFWGLIARMFSLRQQKRILGGIDLGKALATLIAFFTIPVLLSFIPNVANLMLFSMGSLAIFIFIIFILVLRSKNLHFSGFQKTDKQNQQRYSLVAMLGNTYIVVIILYTIFATVGSVFVDYSFLNASATQFPSEKQVGSFLAFFGGVAIIFAILAQTFVADRITENYGLKVTLIINPVLLFGFTLLATLVGTFLGFTAESGSFVLFFLAIALGKLFTESLKDAFDEPTLKLFFFPIDSEIRLDVVSKLDGLIKVIAGFIAGSLLLLIDYAKIFNLLSFSYFLLPIVLVWIFLVLRMHHRYREALKNTLQQGKVKLQTVEQLSLSPESILENHLRHQTSPEATMLGLEILEYISPHYFAELSTDFYEKMPPEYQQYITTYFQPPALETFMQDEEKLQNYGRSFDDAKRLQVVQYLKFYGNEQLHTPLIKRLLKDPNDEIRRQAALAAQHFSSEEVALLLINLLADNLCGSAAAASLRLRGESIIPLLHRAFYKANQEESVLVWIIIIARYIGTETALQFLWEQIDHPIQDVVEQVLLSFNILEIDITKDKESSIEYFLEVEMGDAVWDVAALDEIENKPFNKALKQSLWEEIKYNFDAIFNLLELRYDAKSVKLVKENLQDNTSEGKVFALELLDVFIDEKLKRTLIPIIESVDAIIDDIDSVKKNEMLQVYFPREDLSPSQVLRNLMIRDYKFTNRWTRACAMFSLANMPEDQHFDELIANLFHPDTLLSETAAWAIFQKKPELLATLLERLPEKQAQSIRENVILHKDWERKPHPLMFQKVLFLTEVQLAQDVPGDLLVNLVDILQEHHLKTQQTVALSQDTFWLVAQGRLSQKEGDLKLGAGDFWGHQWRSPLAEPMLFTAQEPSTLYAFPKVELYALMRVSYHFLQLFLHNIHQYFYQEKLEEQLID